MVSTGRDRQNDVPPPMQLPAAPATPNRSRVIYLAYGVHRHGGMERAAYEVIDRLRAHRDVVVVARECECAGVRFVPVWAPRRPAVIQVAWFKWRARRAARKWLPAITTGIGASGGPVDVVVAQYCQAAYRQRVGAVRGKGWLRTLYHRWTMARFCAEERAVYRNPRLKRVVAVSHGVGRELVEFYGVDPAVIRHIPNGVDLSVFRPADADERRQLRERLGLPTEAFLACFVGGDWRRKGLRAAIESLRGLAGVHLVVAGAGDVDEFAAHAAAAGAADRVHFVGKRPDPQSYMRASDAYVFPSLYEAFSLSCIEAAACGLPLVVTRINGAEELVEDGTNGFFVDHDGGSIAAALRRLRDDPALRDRLSAHAAADARRYAWDAIAAEHGKVYDELDPPAA